MFLFSDPSLLAGVIAAQKRGVKVRVMLNPARRGGEPRALVRWTTGLTLLLIVAYGVAIRAMATKPV